MQKISVITLHAVHNYGSALQAYATQRIFEEMGLDAEIVDYRRKNILPESVFEILRSKNRSLVLKMKLILMKNSSKKAFVVFESFLNEHLKMTTRRYTEDEDFLKFPIDADIYCTGSDQVWNTDWQEEVPEPFFLSFAPDDKPKIAFSASFGKSGLADWERNKIRELLLRYDAISVRELSGIDILKNLGIENGKLVVDPTQIVRPDVWYDLASTKKYERPYVLIYQLCNNKKFDNEASKFAKEKGLELVRICTRYDQLRKPGRGIVLPKVEEYLSLIRDAEYVLTDSFHGTSFSLIFRKKFVCFQPNRFGSRLTSILDIVDLQGHMMDDKIDREVIEEGIDYDKVGIELEVCRENGLCFLKDAIGNE